MRDSQKTRTQLLNELNEARRQLEVLAAAEVERKQVGDELSKSEEKFYKAFLASPDMIIISSLSTGKYIDVNDSFLKITGYSREELIGHAISDCNLFVDPQEEQRVKDILLKNGAMKNEEFHMRVRSGEIRRWLCSAQQINIGGDTCMISVAVDVTELKKMEQALRESEEKFYKAFNFSPQAITITTLKEGRFIAANETHSRLTGYNREELVGRTADEMGFWEQHGGREKTLRLLKEKGRIYNEEMEFRSRTGSPIIALFSAEIININGEECMISSTLDITERKKTEQALRESEEKFSKAFNLSPIAVALISIEKSKFLEVNDNMLLFLGYSREEIIGHTSSELNLWVNKEDMRLMDKQLRETGTMVNMEIRSRGKSGEIRTGLFSAQTIDIGKHKRLLLVITDITEQEKAKAALRESEEKFSKIFHASPDMISISRLADGIFLDVNESFSRVNEYTREETIGHSSLELNIWVNSEDRKKMLQILIKQGRVINEEYLLRSKSGEIHTMLFSAERIEYEGEPCVLAVTNDISDFKRMEAQLLEAENLKKVDNLRAELLANVSHELRTPLASIKGFATMLLDYEKRLKPDEKREYLEIIDKNSDRLVGLIEQLIEMSRLSAGMLSINRTSINILRLCRDTIARAREMAAGYVFILDLPPRLPRVTADVQRIRQVLDNLIDNAIKYSQPGGEIALSVRRTGTEMLFNVTDHGIGISKDDLPHIFERMFRSTLRQKSGIPGAGLGLPICKALIEAHGGRIWIESEEGVGTRCYFTLPRKPETP